MSKKDRSIFVTSSFLPPIDEYKAYVDKIWENNQITNRGPLLQEFEAELEQYLQVKNLQFVTNGTLALQLAIDGLDIHEGEIITTPFSYVATTSAILWQHCTPVFVDINPHTLCIDSDKIEAAISPNTKAILPVHVFGTACDVDAIQKIADKHSLKVIYDGAHAFSVSYKGKSLLDYGDISIASFHATKLFHTIEGGAVISKSRKVHDRIDLKKRFGHNNDEHFSLGINAKASEFQAAMGLVNLKYVDSIIGARRKLVELYDNLLGDRIERPRRNSPNEHNYAYYPVIFDSEKSLSSTVARLNSIKVFPRRYFYPSLNTLPYIEDAVSCPISEDISKRILCLPLYPTLDEEVVKQISMEILK